jgi:membrane protein DedA with SNARE-associated domain
MPNTNQIIDLIRDQYLSYGYLIVLVAAFLEYIIGVGFLWPGGTLILLGVLYCVNGQLSLPLLIGAVWIGAVLGNLVTYWLGLAGVLRLIKASRFYPKIEPYLERAHNFMLNYGRRSVFISQFIGYVRPFVSLLAGAVRLPFHHFLVYQIPAALIWNIIFCGVGFLLVKSFSNVEMLMSGLGIAIMAIVAVAWFGYRFFLRRRLFSSKKLVNQLIDRDPNL